MDAVQVSYSDDPKELILGKLGDDVKTTLIQGPDDQVITIRTEEDLADGW